MPSSIVVTWGAHMIIAVLALLLSVVPWQVGQAIGQTKQIKGEGDPLVATHLKALAVDKALKFIVPGGTAWLCCECAQPCCTTDITILCLCAQQIGCSIELNKVNRVAHYTVESSLPHPEFVLCCVLNAQAGSLHLHPHSLLVQTRILGTDTAWSLWMAVLLL